MQKFALSLALVVTLVGGIARGDEQANIKTGNVAARMGDDALDSGSREIYVYTKVELEKVFVRTTTGTWFKTTYFNTRDGFVQAFGTEDVYFPFQVGNEFHVRGIRKDGTGFEDLLKVTSVDGAKTVIAVSNMKQLSASDVAAIVAAEKAAAEAAARQIEAQRAQQATQYSSQFSGQMARSNSGGPFLENGMSLQDYAQNRVNQMANSGSGAGHLGGAVVRLADGRMAFEGMGMGGGSSPHTCWARGGNCLADATCVSPKNGMTYRITFWDRATHR
jgi:hypothetical protein